MNESLNFNAYYVLSVFILKMYGKNKLTYYYSNQ